MATLMEQFLFDLEARSVRLRARPVRTLLVAAAPAERLLPWGSYFGLGHSEFAKLSTKGGQKIAATSFTGATVASGGDLFYAQACSLSLYLFAGEGGRHRAKLMEYVGAYYRGESPQISDCFGMSHAELGKKAHAYVRRLAER